jgi:hypothetical protein
LIAFFALALTMVGLLGVRSRLPASEIAVLAICVSIPSVWAFRILKVLGELERRTAEPDHVMVLLFDLSLTLPIISAMFAGFVLNVSR